MAAENNISGVYSFLDFNVAITGPNVSADLSGSGFSGEGVKITMLEEKDTMTIGAGGAGMHALRGSKAGKVIISLLKTGPGNALLSQAYNLDSQSSATWGRNQVTISNPVSGDNITCQNCAFIKQPDNANGDAGGMMEWEFNSTLIDQILGNGFVPTGI